MNQLCLEASRARLFLEGMTRQIIAQAGQRRQQPRGALGARAPAALAAPPVTLQEIVERIAGGTERKTLPGHKTAARRVPPVLADLERADPRRRAADVLADVCERIESVRGSKLEGADKTGLVSDGGATSRVALAATLCLIEATVNDWPLDPKTRRFRRGADLIILRPRNAAGNRLPIKAMGLLRMVALDHATMRDVLAAHGWADHSAHKRILRRATLDLLDLVAVALFSPARRTRAGLTGNVGTR